MAVGQQGEFVAVVNDTDPTSGGKSYSLKISGNNHAQLLGKKIGDTVDGIFVGEGEQTLSCLLYTSPSPRDRQKSRMPSSA